MAKLHSLSLRSCNNSDLEAEEDSLNASMVLREVTVAFLLWSAGNVVVESQQERLSLMFITSGGGQYNSSGAEPAINLAVSIINSNDIIPGHELVIETRGNSYVSAWLFEI